MQKRVGIIIPIYNVAKFLDECLQSAINQTYSNLVILCIDDGSTDESFEIAKSYFLQDSRIVLIQKPNGGQSSARNVGIDYCNNELQIGKYRKDDGYYITQGIYTYRGCFDLAQQEHESVKLHKNQDIIIYTHTTDFQPCEYVYFLDSDDLLALHCIESCMQIVEREKDIDLVWHDFYSIDENGKKIGENIQFRDKHIISDSNYIFVDYSTIFHLKLQTTNGFAWGGLISLQVINSRRLRFMDSVYAEDQAFAFMLFAIVNRIVLMTQSLYGYRHRIGSTENFNPQVHTYPKFKSDIYQSFKNKILAKEYDISHSWLIMANTLYDFKDTLQNQEKQHLVFAACLYCTPHRVKALYTIAIEKKDPKAAIKLFTRLYTILPKNHFKIPTKIAYYMPSAYRIFYIFKNILNTLRKK